MNRAKVVMSGLGAALALVTSTVLAVPTECSIGASLRNYDAAKRREQRYVEGLFKSSYGCRELERFAADMYDLIPRAGAADVCEILGIRDGILETVAEIRNACIGR
ncbi:hypothetical protein WME90_36360 [Sorangium sp. So ce375]|uniref:hypothetical protein n=1 Tax=Sorangium sp. So ce375 TaxID=3133306 RepID=UPI003F5C203B